MQKSRDKIIVELWGLPGVGKTTLAKQLKKAGFHFISSNTVRINHFSLSVLHPIVVLVWFFYILRTMINNRSFLIARYNAAVFFDSLEKIHSAQKSKHKMIVIDEGMIQRLLSISDVIHSSEQIDFLLKWSPLGDISVFVNDRVIEKNRYDSSHPRVVININKFVEWQQNMFSLLPLISDRLNNISSVAPIDIKDDRISFVKEMVHYGGESNW